MDLSKILFRVKKTQIEMMGDRGFNAHDEQYLLDANLDQFKQSYSFTDKGDISNLSKIYGKEGSSEQIYVHYLNIPEKKGKRERVKNISLLENRLSQIMNTSIDTVVIISKAPMDNKVKDDLLNMPRFNFQYFLYEELITNKTRHRLVPTHHLLNLEESINFLRSTQISRNQLPKICFDDPIAKYYGAIPGMIFKITRKPLNIPVIVKESITFRTVSPDSYTTGKSK